MRPHNSYVDNFSEVKTFTLLKVYQTFACKLGTVNTKNEFQKKYKTSFLGTI